MSGQHQRRRRSDDDEFIQTDVDVDAVADVIFARYVGEQPIVIEGTAATATYFDPAYCPDLRVMKMAGRLALAVNREALRDRQPGDVKVPPLRVSIEEIMLAALMHDLGKHHEDCKPLIELMRTRDLRAADEDDSARKAHLLAIVRDVHCRKGPCMIDRLREAGRPELNNPFIATVARRHGDAYESNQSAGSGCWWAREINVITIADDYDAMTSSGPERAYKRKSLTEADAAALIRAGAASGRYEPQLAEIFLDQVAGQTARAD